MLNVITIIVSKTMMLLDNQSIDQSINIVV